MKKKIEVTDENCAKTKKDAIEAIEKAEHFFLIAVQTNEENADQWKSTHVSQGNVFLLADRVDTFMQNDDDYKKALFLMKMKNMLDIK